MVGRSIFRLLFVVPVEGDRGLVGRGIFRLLFKLQNMFVVPALIFFLYRRNTEPYKSICWIKFKTHMFQYDLLAFWWAEWDMAFSPKSSIKTVSNYYWNTKQSLFSPISCNFALFCFVLFMLHFCLTDSRNVKNE